MIASQIDAAMGCGRTSLTRISNRLAGYGQPCAEVEITVSNGMHSGCSTVIDDSAFSVGQAETADIMLLDPDIDGPLVELRIVQTLLGPAATLTTERDDVRLNGVGGAGGAPYAKLPCTLSIGSVSLDIRARPVSKPPKVAGNDLLTIAGLATVGCMAMAISFWAPARQGTIVSMPPTQDVHAAPVGTTSLSDMVARQIMEAEMGQYMTTDIGLDDTVVVSGTVPKNKMPEWHDLRGAIDAHPEAGRIITRIREASVLKNVPAIKMVRLRPVPSVFLANGTMLAIDDELIDDWRIVAISANDMTVARAGEQIDIQY